MSKINQQPSSKFKYSESPYQPEEILSNIFTTDYNDFIPIIFLTRRLPRSGLMELPRVRPFTLPTLSFFLILVVFFAELFDNIKIKFSATRVLYKEKALTEKLDKCLILLAHQGGLEPPAYGLEVLRQLVGLGCHCRFQRYHSGVCIIHSNYFQFILTQKTLPSQSVRQNTP